MPELTLTLEQMIKVCEPKQVKGSRYRLIRGTNGRLLVNVNTGQVCTMQSYDISQNDKKMVLDALETKKRPFVAKFEGNDKQWATAAILSELENLERCGDDNPHRQDSEYWVSLVKIASILKGSGKRHIDPERVRAAILRYSPYSLKTKGERDKDIMYLFSRAMNKAYPRYRIKGVK